MLRSTLITLALIAPVALAQSQADEVRQGFATLEAQIIQLREAGQLGGWRQVMEISLFGAVAGALAMVIDNQEQIHEDLLEVEEFADEEYQEVFLEVMTGYVLYVVLEELEPRLSDIERRLAALEADWPVEEP